jgi:hypothetical protein
MGFDVGFGALLEGHSASGFDVCRLLFLLTNFKRVFAGRCVLPAFLSPLARFGKAHRRITPEPQLSPFAARRHVAEEPAFRTALGDVQVKPLAVQVHALLLDALNIERDEPVFDLPPDHGRRFPWGSNRWAYPTFFIPSFIPSFLSGLAWTLTNGQEQAIGKTSML